MVLTKFGDLCLFYYPSGNVELRALRVKVEACDTDGKSGLYASRGSGSSGRFCSYSSNSRSAQKVVRSDEVVGVPLYNRSITFVA